MRQDDQLRSPQPFAGDIQVADQRVRQAQFIEPAGQALRVPLDAPGLPGRAPGDRLAPDDHDPARFLPETEVGDVKPGVGHLPAPGRDAQGVNGRPAGRLPLDQGFGLVDPNLGPAVFDLRREPGGIPAVAAAQVKGKVGDRRGIGREEQEAQTPDGGEVQPHPPVPGGALDLRRPETAGQVERPAAAGVDDGCRRAAPHRLPGLVQGRRVRVGEIVDQPITGPGNGRRFPGLGRRGGRHQEKRDQEVRQPASKPGPEKPPFHWHLDPPHDPRLAAEARKPGKRPHLTAV
ncbi:MAG: hypothetical protein BWY73_00425 [candidate division TA06 bacterium ADurb.Bin417]|uniref:Uncharacterized protein n=1 Tax=candidate division TA06 bacterium ADurb.Bin417 TaxID=1852828 RepID=A0A1V5MJ30_UNCT6|nr:MAG: hypothetical protein BWY73_00425 [candidate division TA06 bacterium ADurb.Bin417]